jgi:penicillin-binding protein 1A
VAGALTLALSAILAADRLPALDALTDYRPKVPLRVWTADGVLIGEFGEERRSVVRFDEVPAVMKHAILAAEDDRFFEHRGVDVLGIVRAAFANVAAGGKTQGASTITMQLARNFFLSNERSYTRKIYEILLALRIESTLSKEQILEIYLNQIFLGQRAYGFASAAQIYFGKPLAKVTPAEAAMLAGLPKAPSAYNPVVNPKRARIRQLYVLGRMRTLGHLTEEQYQDALKEPLRLQPDRFDYALKAPYVAELARMLARELAGEELSARRLAERVVGDVGAFRAMAVALLASGRVSGADGARYVVRALRTVDAAQAAMPTVERAVSSFCAVRL